MMTLHRRWGRPTQVLARYWPNTAWDASDISPEVIKEDHYTLWQATSLTCFLEENAHCVNWYNKTHVFLWQNGASKNWPGYQPKCRQLHISSGRVFLHVSASCSQMVPVGPVHRSPWKRKPARPRAVTSHSKKKKRNRKITVHKTINYLQNTTQGKGASQI